MNFGLSTSCFRFNPLIPLFKTRLSPKIVFLYNNKVFKFIFLTYLMRITTWNVNSIRVRMDHLLSWLAFTSPDIVALQETKCEDDKFPAASLEEIGYHSIFFGQKSYNGVALLSRQPLTRYFIEGYLGDHDQRRVIAAEYQDCLIVNVYVPNGQAVGSEKYAFKLVWLKALAELLNTLKKKFSKIIILGDFN